MSELPIHYRYIDEIGPAGVTISCKKFVAVRESEHFFWIVQPSYELVARHSIERGRIPRYAKRVPKVSTKRFAYPDKAAALESYKARKRWQMSHATLALERAKTALEAISESKEITDEHTCPGGDYIKQLGWGSY
ncbi:hypothetical protein [Pseudomonas sp. 5P_3.1_Bac2]|uniref:hypothetical protein n=1 Tax=Pseudomonas sp. 5P_3.1_Bac2 TaxID=2971617 RepID=UPI0021C7409C|nr:hypothetical protein [Pseudomonas sp. 5P_3.1_Bac2]MCU1717345.1 hypothetical protein [Pseudomonas sp. 5P_3.1_Bac2]